MVPFQVSPGAGAPTEAAWSGSIVTSNWVSFAMGPGPRQNRVDTGTLSVRRRSQSHQGRPWVRVYSSLACEASLPLCRPTTPGCSWGQSLEGGVKARTEAAGPAVALTKDVLQHRPHMYQAPVYSTAGSSWVTSRWAILPMDSSLGPNCPRESNMSPFPTCWKGNLVEATIRPEDHKQHFFVEP